MAASREAALQEVPSGWHNVQPSPQLQKAFPKVVSRAAESLACSCSCSMLGGVWLTFSCISAQATSPGLSTLDCKDTSSVMGSKSQSGPKAASSRAEPTTPVKGRETRAFFRDLQGAESTGVHLCYLAREPGISPNNSPTLPQN